MRTSRGSDPWPRRYEMANRVGLILGDILWPVAIGFLLWKCGH